MALKSEFILISITYLTMLKSLGTRSQNPESPCPNIFQYQYNQQAGLYGEVRISPEPTNFLRMNLQMSIGNAVEGYNGKLELANSKEAATTIANNQPLLYYLYFPRWHSIPPKITQILLNGNLICSGPKIPANSVPLITTVNLQHTLRINVQPLSSSNVPPESNFIPVRDTPQIPVEEPPDMRYEFYEWNQFGGSKQPVQDVDKNKFNFHPTLPPNKYNFRPKPQNNATNPSDVYKDNPFFNNRHIANDGNFNNNPRPTPVPIPNPTPRPNPTALRPTQGIPPIMPPTVAPFLTAPGAEVEFPNDFDLASKDSIQPTRPFDDVCGQSISTNHLIFNGQLVPRGAYPWLVAIFQVKTTGLNYICSGSLISNKHVVTAAHCVETDHKKLRPQEVLLILGKLNIHKWIPVRGEKIVEPESIHIHPDYESLTSDADIAVLVLSDPLQFTKYIRPVCLWRGDTDLSYVVGHTGTIVGWGKDEHGILMTEEPKQTNLPIVSQEKCLASNLQFHYITSNRTFCAGFRNDTGPCNGDSGGGFVMKHDGRWMLRGIVSLSISETYSKSCDLSNYVVFNDATKFLNWLLAFLQ